MAWKVLRHSATIEVVLTKRACTAERRIAKKQCYLKGRRKGHSTPAIPIKGADKHTEFDAQENPFLTNPWQKSRLFYQYKGTIGKFILGRRDHAPSHQ